MQGKNEKKMVFSVFVKKAAHWIVLPDWLCRYKGFFNSRAKLLRPDQEVEKSVIMTHWEQSTK